MLQVAKFILLYFIWRMGDDFHKKFQISEKKVSIYFITLSFFGLSLLHKP